MMKTPVMEQTDIKPQDNATKTSSRHVLKYTGVFGSVQGLKLLSSVARNKLTTALLGSVGFGLISVYNSISEFVANCSNFGLPLNITREASELQSLEDHKKIVHFACVARTWAFWAAIIGALLTLLLSPLLSYYFLHKEAGRYVEVVVLAPIVVSLLIAEAECSLLKGLRRLKRVAVVETICAITTLLLTIPFYYFFGLRGVVLGLTASTLFACLVHVFFTATLIPYKIKPFSFAVFKEGWPMVRRGIPYVMAGIANSGAGLLVTFIILSYSMEDLGLYRAGYTLMVSYAGLIFKALDSEYYPRLSGVNHDKDKVAFVVNQQVEVCVNLVVPFLILFVLCMPIVIQLQFKSDFLVILNMTICAGFYLFFRAINLPVSYTMLAKGDSRIFLLMEILSNAVFLLSFFYFYPRHGLMGAGIALSVASFIDMTSNLLLFKLRYGCELFLQTVRICVFQFLMLAGSLAICYISPSWHYRMLAVPLLVYSALYSFKKLIKKD